MAESWNSWGLLRLEEALLICELFTGDNDTVIRCEVELLPAKILFVL